MIKNKVSLEEAHLLYALDLEDLLVKCADDELINSHSLAESSDLSGPALEPLVAVMSIVQDDTGHATLWYELLESLTHISPDIYAFARKSNDFTNSSLTELRHDDWVYLVVKNNLYKWADSLRNNILKDCGIQEIMDITNRMILEDNFHAKYWEMWLKRLNSWPESKDRVSKYFNEIYPSTINFFDIPLLQRFQSMHADTPLIHVWNEFLSNELEKFGIKMNTLIETPEIGYRGKHNEEFDEMIADMQSVYASFPGGVW